MTINKPLGGEDLRIEKQDFDFIDPIMQLFEAQVEKNGGIRHETLALLVAAIMYVPKMDEMEAAMVPYDALRLRRHFKERVG